MSRASAEVQKTKRILIVDDEEDIREFLTEAFIEQGFDVLQAENGLIATEMLKSEPANFDLVISDISMPELDGISLFHFIRMNCPKVKVVLISGIVIPKLMINILNLGVSRFIEKPFLFKDILVVVQEMLLSDQGKMDSGSESRREGWGLVSV